MTEDFEGGFKRELEIFHREADAATRFLYAYLAVHAAMADRQAVRDLLNEASLFWGTILEALQQSAFIALGRIFDQDKKSNHNLDGLLRLAQDNHHIFTREALARRKQDDSPDASKRLPAYLQRVHEPTGRDFRRLRAHARKWRRVYERNYRPIRNQHFAHKGRIDASVLFARTNIRELQLLLKFLRQLENTLWELFHNGWKPVLRPQRYSVQRMRQRPSKLGRGKSVQESILVQAEQFLVAVATASRDRRSQPSRRLRRTIGSTRT